MITNNQGGVISRHDYLPFGEEINAGVDGRTAGQGYVNDGVRQKFTGYERDDETGLDYAQARHYSSTMGRFTAIDPVLTSARKTDPKTWNRYAYVLNNPMRFVDPCGLQQEDSIQNIVDKVRNRPIEESGTQLATNILN